MPFKIKPPLYSTWQNMLNRCSNPNHPQWKWYGRRGISVCERWNVYKNFAADMGSKPSPLHSIDRIDNDGHYEPENCRWATRVDQARNQSRTRFVIIDGIQYCAADLANMAGIKTDTILARVKDGLPYSEIISLKKRHHTISRADLYKGLELRAHRYRIRTHCKAGHEFTPGNTGQNSYGGRQCRECRRIGMAKLRARK
jgi:hypothetical protein